MKRNIYSYKVNYCSYSKQLKVEQKDVQILAQTIQYIKTVDGDIYFKDEIGEIINREYLDGFKSYLEGFKSYIVYKSMIYEEGSMNQLQKNKLRKQVGDVIRSILTLQIQHIRKQFNKLK